MAGVLPRSRPRSSLDRRLLRVRRGDAVSLRRRLPSRDVVPRDAARWRQAEFAAAEVSAATEAGTARARARRHTAGFRSETEGLGDLVGGREAGYLLYPTRTVFGGASSAAERTKQLQFWARGNRAAVADIGECTLHANKYFLLNGVRTKN